MATRLAAEEHISPLEALSPVDGRYWAKVKPLAAYFSEGALFRYRVRVEANTLDVLRPLLKVEGFEVKVRGLYAKERFGDDSASLKRLKALEAVTNHDVKAVEYFLKEELVKILPKELEPLKEFVHFGLTSQDINNVAIPLALKEAIETEYKPRLEREVLYPLRSLAKANMNVPMLARTHGQPATPVRVGQMLMVFVYRVEQQLKLLNTLPHSAKFSGATGGFNAHVVAYPQIDWIEFGNKFISSLGLEREQWTTQISNYDNLCALLDNARRINSILLGFCRDMWTYISMEYFKQKVVATEVGSSAMPHKVNPIDFENAEGNLGLANSTFDHLSNKLPVSRMQRDLTDSTVLRNLGIPFAHIAVAFSSIARGLGKLTVNEKKLKDDLLENFIVVSEAIQTVLRREAYPEPYEKLKQLTRNGEHLTPEAFHAFIATLEVSDKVKDELRVISPFSFIGAVPPH